MNLNDVRSAISGRRVDVDGGKWFGTRILLDGGPSKSEPIGTMPALNDAKTQDWSAVQRAWAQEPSVEERLRALS